MAEYEHLRQRHLADLASLMSEHVQRLRWPAGRLRQERRDRLRDLLRAAKASSPWHCSTRSTPSPPAARPAAGGSSCSAGGNG
jgi:hypothetical protein